jgi:two-component system sensor histidine kinase YesM
MASFGFQHLTRSLRFKLGLFLVSVSIPLSASLVFQSWYAVNVVHNQVAESQGRLLDVYVTRIDGDLDHVSQFLKVLVVTDPSLPTLDEGKLDDDYQFQKLQLAAKLDSFLSLYPAVTGFFAYSAATDDVLLATRPDSGKGVLGRETVHRFLKTFEPPLDQRWIATRIAGRNLLFRAVRSYPTLVGAWIDIDDLLAPLKLSDPDGAGLAALVGSDGQCFPDLPVVAQNAVQLLPPPQAYRLSGNPVRYLVNGAPSVSGSFHLISLLNDDKILQQLPALRSVNAAVAFVVLVMVLGFFLFLRWTVLKPLRQLMGAMTSLQEGNWESRLAAVSSSREFEVVNQTFNEMVGQIHHLRISVYEEQLHAQKSELLSLRLQINPHFFLNSLNILYQLAQTKSYALIQELTMALAKYFQFMSRTKSDVVWLREEWEHVRTYLRIQEMRFPETLRCGSWPRTPSPNSKRLP